ncbi:MAG: DNA adenine methylase [Hominilimicola sp.]
MNSFIKWIGGKRILRKRIIEEFPAEVERYIEVFGGAGWVLFGKDKHAPFEVFNDIDGDLINLYRCIKYHAPALQEELKYIIHSREIFKNYVSQLHAEGLTDIQRAARYYIIIRGSFGACKENFATDVTNLSGKIDYLTEIQERLRRVVIEHSDFEKLIKTYDRPGALFYLDPPYYAVEKYYNSDFSLSDHERLFNVLTGIKGKFVLSYNADKAILERYKDFNIIPVTRFNTLSATANNTEYKEVIIKNF